MDDVLKKLSNVENAVADIRAQVSSLMATVAHLATKTDVSLIKADLSQVESSLIKWLVGTLLAVAVLTFTIARFVRVGG